MRSEHDAEAGADAPTPTPSRLKVFIFYTLMIGATVALRHRLRTTRKPIQLSLLLGLKNPSRVAARR